MRYAIGVDLGGSSAKLALVDEAGRVLRSDRVAMPTDGEPESILAPMVAAIERLIAQARGDGHPAAALGCAVTAYLDAAGDALDLCNIRALDGFRFTTWLRGRIPLPLVVDNDACMAAIGETAVAAPSEARRVLFVTIGSGIGVVLLVDGVIVRVMHGVTGDAGHLLVNLAGQERCLSGCRGCLETVAAAPAIARAGRAAALDGRSAALAAVLAGRGMVTGVDVATAARGGDEAARAILHEAGEWLGAGLASWAATYEPEVILLGGGVSEAGQEWLDAAIGVFRAVGMPILAEKVAVRRAALGNTAGCVGAALSALSRGREQHFSAAP